ncbi:hypothetical protein LNKW23_11790 [Paralimibaculum aggregatum]|uniref:OmpA-like domain-containing protein n=1 Tax=Paralimibaculum aggregatum TaxID=3036245 RepID=A0ABQ6LNG2_9RHOB|nr:OmpA family protein [Limibaculum sp. NKW23]GMG81966.1 hypothetical protein LNKW23_11790 [Limibaculum sp. NKW23]
MRIALFAMAATMALSFQSGPAAAQSSEADLLKRFQQQQQTHRGLSLSPVTSTGATAVGAAAATPAPEADPAPQATTAARAPKPAAAQPQRAIALPPEAREYVRMPEGSEINIRIQFGYDSAVLAPSEFGKLEALCNAIQQSGIGQFRIYGHTDASGSDAYNLRLSQRRAESVRAHMVNYCGISGARLQAVGLGETFPLGNSSPRAPENRRVEFQALG